METMGLVIFYIGVFGFFAGIGTLIRGSLPALRIYNRKHAFLAICLSLALVIAGSQIVGRF